MCAAPFRDASFQGLRKLIIGNAEIREQRDLESARDPRGLCCWCSFVYFRYVHTFSYKLPEVYFSSVGGGKSSIPREARGIAIVQKRVFENHIILLCSIELNLEFLRFAIFNTTFFAAASLGTTNWEYK